MRSIWSTALLALVAVALGGAASADAARGPAALSRTPVAQRSGWHRYVLDSPTEHVLPRRVIVEGDAGAVSDPDALKAADGRAATLRSTGLRRPRLVLDLGVNVGGRVEVGVVQSDGTTIHLAYAEARRWLTEQGDMVPAITLGANDDPDGRTDDISATGPTQFVSPGVRGAQRWILLQLQGRGSVSIDYVRVRVTHVRPAARDYVGRFLSSDDLLNRTWWGAAYTWNVASFSDPRRGGHVVVTDAGKRDRLAWLGDMVIAGEIAAYSHRLALPIMRDTLALFSCQQYADGYIPMASDVHLVCDEPGPPDGPPPGTSPVLQALRLPSYTACWVIGLAEFVQLSGDREFASKMLPVVRRAIGYFERNRDATGMFRTGGPTEPVVINWHPLDVAVGHDAHTQALWYRALGDAAELEQLLGAGLGAAQRLRAEAAALQQATIANLWDERVGALRLNTLDPLDNHTHDAQVEGALDGLLDADKARRALAFVDSMLRSPYGPLNGEFDGDPFMSQYISPFVSASGLFARFERGDGVGAIGLLRRLYGYMVTHDPASTMWEKLNRDGTPASSSPLGAGRGIIPDNLFLLGRGMTSLAHPWSGAPVPALSKYVAGLQQVALGWRSWRVAPQPVDLRWVQGQVGTPRGALAARWARGKGDRWLVITVTAPRRTSGTVAVPLLGRARIIARDGRIVWRAGRPRRGVDARAEGDSVVFVQRGRRSTYAWGSVPAR
ncbi:MAG: hypothetical protein QOE31_3053 [Solirubrobacteraceae bacterium]|nr:hypothetical protein [Solirubrobacteraceae bacterium]